METKFETEPEAGVSSLVSGIIQDSRQLLTQQMSLFKVELKNDLHRMIMACIPLLVGAALCFLGLFMLLHAAAYFVCWRWELPYWAGYSIVGGGMAVVGVCLLIWAGLQFRRFSPLPEKSIEGLKENFEWKTKA